MTEVSQPNHEISVMSFHKSSITELTKLTKGAAAKVLKSEWKSMLEITLVKNIQVRILSSLPLHPEKKNYFVFHFLRK